MDARYEWTNGEMNLTVVDQVNTYPQPEHGKLSALLEWNEMDLPDLFEYNRNNVVHRFQKIEIHLLIIPICWPDLGGR